jgi:hypothetical protein
MRPFAFGLPLTLLLLTTPRFAQAQQAAADALFDSARAAMEKGDFSAACEQFRASDKLDAAVGTELNLADCEEKRGHLASAWELYRTAAEKLSDRDERLALAGSRIEALAPRLPKLTLNLAPGAPKASSVRDGNVELGSVAFGVALPMDPGAHELVVSAPGFESRTFAIRLSEGNAQTLTVSPGGPAGAGSHHGARSAVPVTTAPLAAPRDQGPESSSRRLLGFGFAGAGVAGLGVGTIAGILALGKKRTLDDQCGPDKSCTSAGVSAAKSGHTLQLVSNVGWVVGAAALGAGAYFLLTSGPSSQPATSVALVTTPTGGQLSLSRSF